VSSPISTSTSSPAATPAASRFAADSEIIGLPSTVAIVVR